MSLKWETHERSDTFTAPESGHGCSYSVCSGKHDAMWPFRGVFILKKKWKPLVILRRDTSETVKLNFTFKKLLETERAEHFLPKG